MITTNRLIAFENGQLTGPEVIGLFADLIKSGTAWQLQGMYGRIARDFIESGTIDRAGNIHEESHD